MSERVSIVVPEGDVAADVGIGDLESLDDVEATVAQFVENGRATVVLDLRSGGRPALALPQVIEAATSALGDKARLTCLVNSEKVAAELRRRLRASEPQRVAFRVGPRVVEVLIADIVGVRADAVVNASNTALRLGTGISGALRRACGPRLQDAMLRLAPIGPGGLAVTGAFDLQTTREILHVATVSGAEHDVRRALENVLAHCASHELASVAVPALGTGSGGLEVDRCAAIFRDAIVAHTLRSPREVRVVAWSQAGFDAFLATFRGDDRFISEWA